VALVLFRDSAARLALVDHDESVDIADGGGARILLRSIPPGRIDDLPV